MPAHARSRLAPTLALVALIPLAAGAHAGAGSRTGGGPEPTIVLAHGDRADASSWNSVIKRLQQKNFKVVAPPNLLRGPGPLRRLPRQLPAVDLGPIVLVAHSYGGFVATNAATGNANVKALVYIDAFMPDAGETAGDLVAGRVPASSRSALTPVPSAGGVDLYLRWEANPPYPGYIECFANGVEPEEAAVLAAAQRPAGAAQFVEPSGPPAWKTIPSWSLIGTLDNVIPLALQEQMSSRAGAHITRVKAGHLSLITVLARSRR